jgi:hypothetical protein
VEVGCGEGGTCRKFVSLGADVVVIEAKEFHAGSVCRKSW